MLYYNRLEITNPELSGTWCDCVASKKDTMMDLKILKKHGVYSPVNKNKFIKKALEHGVDFCLFIQRDIFLKLFKDWYILPGFINGWINFS
jgi:hypothetical protein